MQFLATLSNCNLPSVLLRCWLGGKKGIQPVKNEWNEVQMICVWSSWCHCHPIISRFSKIQNGLPFWCRLTQVLLEKRPLNGCSSSSLSNYNSMTAYICRRFIPTAAFVVFVIYSYHELMMMMLFLSEFDGTFWTTSSTGTRTHCSALSWSWITTSVMFLMLMSSYKTPSTCAVPVTVTKMHWV